MTMPTRKIGSLEASVVGLGCNNFGGRIDEARTREVVDATLEAGITFLDTADIYGGTKSEEFLGRALAGRRDRVVLATKFGMRVDDERQGAKPDYVHRALEDSLRRLQTDHVDLYQLHAPDATTPIGDTLGALDEAVRQGKVREIGCSNFSADQLREALDAANGAARFVSVQNEYSILHREPERAVLPACVDSGTAFVPYYPLARGLLTGKYERGKEPPPGTRLAGMGSDDYRRVANDANLVAVEQLAEIAARSGHSVVQLAIAWLAAQPAVASVIAGATSANQVGTNAAAGEWVLSDAELAEVDAVVPPGTSLI